MSDIEKIINDAWEIKDQINPNSDKKIIDAINEAFELLDSGKLRVCQKENGEWKTNQWLKKAIMLSFRTNEMEILKGPYCYWRDKKNLIRGKTVGYDDEQYAKAGFRAVPNTVIRPSAFISKNAVIMPNSFVNCGAWIGENTMLDTGARAGSCCVIGSNCHISAGTGIGGVLEPVQALPTIVEDFCFVGAMCEVTEGCIIGEGSVLASGITISASTKIVERSSGKIMYGKIPPYSVCVAGTLPDKKNPLSPSLACVVIIKTTDEKTRKKTNLNELLRD